MSTFSFLLPLEATVVSNFLVQHVDRFHTLASVSALQGGLEGADDREAKKRSPWTLDFIEDRA